VSVVNESARGGEIVDPVRIGIVGCGSVMTAYMRLIEGLRVRRLVFEDPDEQATPQLIQDPGTKRCASG